MLLRVVKSFGSLGEVKKALPSFMSQKFTPSLNLQVAVKRACQLEQAEASVVTARIQRQQVLW
jgi:hypothetical protein